jgi:hypothetical protein
MGPASRPGDELFWERVRRAKQMDPMEKLLDGFRLFETACRVTLDGIRAQNPGISEADAREVLRSRILLQRKWDEIR